MTVDLAQAQALPVLWIQSENELYELIDEIDDSDVVALDTEFIRRSTYYPNLALVQVNTGKAIYLVDAPKLDLTEFWEALSEVPTMLWYACGEDLNIFYTLAKNAPLTNVFDLQIGMAYLTGQMHMGYSQAVEQLIGIKLDKGESKSNWLARPLSQEQEDYAADDVRYLLAMYDIVKNQLQNAKLLDCVIEDSTLYAKEIHDDTHQDDLSMYLNYISPTYNRLQIGVLQQLVAWREALARITNQPRTFIITKQALREIIDTLPSNQKILASTTLHRAILRKYGDEILRIISQVKSTAHNNLPPMPAPVYRNKEKPFASTLDELIASHSEQTGIPSCLLLRTRWVNTLVQMVADDLPTDSLPQGLQGYRRDWVVGSILPMLYTYQAQIRSDFDAIRQLCDDA